MDSLALLIFTNACTKLIKQMLKDPGLERDCISPTYLSVPCLVIGKDGAASRLANPESNESFPDLLITCALK